MTNEEIVTQLDGLDIFGPCGKPQLLRGHLTTDTTPVQIPSHVAFTFQSTGTQAARAENIIVSASSENINFNSFFLSNCKMMIFQF
jgi:hypothetical protein